MILVECLSDLDLFGFTWFDLGLYEWLVISLYTCWSASQAVSAPSLYLTLRPEGTAHKTCAVTEKDGPSQRDEQMYSHARAETNLVVLSI